MGGNSVNSDRYRDSVQFPWSQKTITGVSSLKEATQDDYLFVVRGRECCTIYSESKAGVFFVEKCREKR